MDDDSDRPFVPGGYHGVPWSSTPPEGDDSPTLPGTNRLDTWGGDPDDALSTRPETPRPQPQRASQPFTPPPTVLPSTPAAPGMPRSGGPIWPLANATRARRGLTGCLAISIAGLAAVVLVLALSIFGLTALSARLNSANATPTATSASQPGTTPSGASPTRQATVAATATPDGTGNTGGPGGASQTPTVVATGTVEATATAVPTSTVPTPTPPGSTTGPLLGVAPTEVTINCLTQQLTNITVKNGGDLDLTWSATVAGPSGATVTPSSGTLAGGTETTVVVKTPGQLLTQTGTRVSFSSNGGSAVVTLTCKKAVG